MDVPSAAKLKTKWENTSWHSSRNPEHPRDDLNLRVYRAIRWFERAELAHGDDDHDVAFILYWIAFNAAYGQTGTAEIGDQREKDTQRDFFRRITKWDQSLLLAIRSNDVFQSQIKIFLSSKFVYEPFWKHLNQMRGFENWEERLNRSNTKAKREIKHVCKTTIQAEVKVANILRELFERLYTLRNQLLHGGATWGSSKNRHQVRLGATLMALLIPHFIDVMIENPDADWGSPRYPVVYD